MAEPTISDILGWTGTSFGTQPGLGGADIYSYLTNVISEAGQYGEVLDEDAFRSGVIPKRGNWIPGSYSPNTYQYDSQWQQGAYEITDPSNVESLGLDAINQIMAGENFLGTDMNREALEELVKGGYAGQFEGFENALDTGMPFMTRYLSDSGLNIGLPGLQGVHDIVGDWRPSNAFGLVEGLSPEDVFYDDYKAYAEQQLQGYQGIYGTPWSGDVEELLSKDFFESHLGPIFGANPGEQSWYQPPDLGEGQGTPPPEFMPSVGYQQERGIDPFLQNIYTGDPELGTGMYSHAFEEGDLASILDYMQAMQEGGRSIGEAQGQFDVGRRLAGAETGAGRAKKSAYRGYMPGEIATRYGGLQGGLGLQAGEGSEVDYLAKIASAERKRARDVRGIHGGLESKTYGAAQRWLENMIT